MIISINCKNRKEYLQELAGLLINGPAQTDFFCGILNHFWEQSYFNASLNSLRHTYPWARNPRAMHICMKQMLKYNLITKDNSETFYYRINPELLIDSGSLNLNINLTIGTVIAPLILHLNTEEKDFIIPSVEDEIILPQPQAVNPRYANLI